MALRVKDGRAAAFGACRCSLMCHMYCSELGMLFAIKIRLHPFSDKCTNVDKSQLFKFVILFKNSSLLILAPCDIVN